MRNALKCSSQHTCLVSLLSLKREMRKLAQEECGFEEPTVAMAFVYFEKLALKGKLNKQNRKLCAGACVLLAAKIGSDLRKHEVKHLIDVRIHRFPVFLLHEVPLCVLCKPACQWSCTPLDFQLYSQLNTFFVIHLYGSCSEQWHCRGMGGSFDVIEDPGVKYCEV